MPNADQNSQAQKPEVTAKSGPTADAFVNIREEAEREDLHRNLVRRMAEANQPKVDNYKTPPIPDAIAKATAAEMAAGKAVVEKFAAQEAVRKEQHAKQQAEKWEGQNTPIFRPDDFVEYKNIKQPAVSKDVTAQPRQPPR